MSVSVRFDNDGSDNLNNRRTKRRRERSRSPSSWKQIILLMALLSLYIFCAIFIHLANNARERCDTRANWAAKTDRCSARRNREWKGRRQVTSAYCIVQFVSIVSVFASKLIRVVSGTSFKSGHIQAIRIASNGKGNRNTNSHKHKVRCALLRGRQSISLCAWRVKHIVVHLCYSLSHLLRHIHTHLQSFECGRRLFSCTRFGAVFTNSPDCILVLTGLRFER